MNFREKLEAQWAQGKFLCVGLDPVMEKIPSSLKDDNPVSEISLFLERIIGATSDYAAAYKPNLAFFGQYGPAGWYALQKVVVAVRHSGAVLIMDGKRTDIGNTNEAYAAELFDRLGADVITVNPYFGGGSLEPFLKRTDKGVFVLCRTTGANSGEIQDLIVQDEVLGPVPLYQSVARRAADSWNANSNVGLVMGALTPDELKIVRGIVGDLPFLIPGVGKQGGLPKDVVPRAIDSRGWGFIINSSRDIIYASNGDDFAEAAGIKARETNEDIRTALAEAA